MESVGTEPGSHQLPDMPAADTVRKVYQKLLRMTKSPEDAKDLTQETLLTYLVHSRYHTINNPLNWMLMTGGNLARNSLRDRQYDTGRIEKLRACEVIRAAAEDLEDALLDKVRQEEANVFVSELLSGVADRNRGWYDVLICTYGLEMSAKETAAFLNLSESAVNSRLQRARRWMRERVADDPWDE